MPLRPPTDAGVDDRLPLSESPSRLDELRDRVLHGDEVPAVLTVRVLHVRSGLVERGRQPCARLGEFDFETEDLLHALEVDAFVRQLLNSSKGREVLIGEAPRTTARSLRVQETAALVVAKRLRVNARQLGEHRDHVHRVLLLTLSHWLLLLSK